LRTTSGEWPTTNSKLKNMTDPISDMLTRLRNAGHALRPTVEVPHSRVKADLAAILKKEGYVADVGVSGDKIKTINVKLKYQGKESVIEGMRRISRPGLRHYVGATKIPRVRGGLGVAVISTPEGVMTGMDARKKNLGGEVLCYVW
jgi:small subunit ribosomal protein S8